jgi:hypothetical protein
VKDFMRDEQKYAPLAIFVYNRLEHTKNLLSSLEKCTLCDQTDVFIFSDGVSNDWKTKEAKVGQLRQYLTTYKKHHPFKSLTIIKRRHNLGLANSVIQGTTYVIKHYGKVIVLEDDLIVTKDFLLFMNEGLRYYEKHKRIWSICAHTELMEFPKSYKQDIYLALRAGSWGWATWENRWSRVDWEVKDYKCFMRNPIAKLLWKLGGSDRLAMLEKQMKGDLDSWAIRWEYAALKHHMYTVRPIHCRVRNCGLDGSGVHCGKSNVKQAELYDGDRLCKFKNVKPKFEILRECYRFYLSGQ